MQEVMHTGIVQGKTVFFGLLLLLCILIAILIIAWRKIHLLFIAGYNREIRNIMTAEKVSEIEAKAIYSEQRKAFEAPRRRRAFSIKSLIFLLAIAAIISIAKYYSN